MLFKKYQLPINIFINFEKLNPIIYTSKNLTSNHYLLIINNNWYYSINLFIKKELLYNLSYLSEMSVIDSNKYNNYILNIKNKNKHIMYNIYYHYLIKIRLTLIQISNKKKSIDSIYKNANWLEREVAEMYNIYILDKNDSRSLLLDYSNNEFPMLKNFPTEGYYELYYDFFENKINYLKTEFIEL